MTIRIRRAQLTEEIQEQMDRLDTFGMTPLAFQGPIESGNMDCRLQALSMLVALLSIAIDDTVLNIDNH